MEATQPGERVTQDWSEAELARLPVLWGEGHSTAEIGRRMGRTKSSIVGKAQRLGLDGRPSPIGRGNCGLGAAPAKPYVPKAKPLREGAKTLPPLSVVAALPVDIFKPRKRGGCLWPAWADHERPTHVYCGDPVAYAGEPYCQHHRGIAWVPLSPRVRAANAAP